MQSAAFCIDRPLLSIAGKGVTAGRVAGGEPQQRITDEQDHQQSENRQQ